MAINIRRIRKSLGMSQEELADALGFKVGIRLSEIERCRNSITLRQLVSLAGKLGVNPTDLLVEHKLPIATSIMPGQGHETT